jgi:predicted dehydrogenase
MIRCALVGYGWWGRTIASRCRASSEVAIALVVDPSDLSQAAAVEAGFETAASLDTALADSGIDAVILATPHSFHEAQVTAAAKAGKHVFCEKPLGLTLASAARSIEACRHAGVVLGIGHERRFEPAMRRLKELVGSGALGTILHAEADFSHDKIANVAADNWRRNTAECPAGGMTGGGIHLTDLLIAMFGQVEVVSALAITSVPEWETGISAQLGFACSMTATVASILVTPHYVRFRVFGTKAWAEVINPVHPDVVDGKALLTLYPASGEETTTEFGYEDTVLANLEAFARAVSGKAAYPITPEAILHNTEVLEAVTRAAQDRSTIRLARSASAKPMAAAE